MELTSSNESSSGPVVRAVLSKAKLSSRLRFGAGGACGGAGVSADGTLWTPALASVAAASCTAHTIFTHSLFLDCQPREQPSREAICYTNSVSDPSGTKDSQLLETTSSSHYMIAQVTSFSEWQGTNQCRRRKFAGSQSTCSTPCAGAGGHGAGAPGGLRHPGAAAASPLAQRAQLAQYCFARQAPHPHARAAPPQLAQQAPSSASALHLRMPATL